MTPTAIKRNTLGRDSAVIFIVLALCAAGYFILSPSPDCDGLIEMGNEAMDLRNYEVAVESYRRALELKPDMVDVRTDFGACLHAMGLPGRAIEEFHKVIAAAPSHPIAHFNMGIVYYDLQQPDSARAYWDKYLALDPNGNAAEVVRELLAEMKR